MKQNKNKAEWVSVVFVRTEISPIACRACVVGGISSCSLSGEQAIGCLLNLFPAAE